MTSLTELQITMIDIERRLHNLEMCIESIWKEWQVMKEKEIGKFEKREVVNNEIRRNPRQGISA